MAQIIKNLQNDSSFNITKPITGNGKAGDYSQPIKKCPDNFIVSTIQGIIYNELKPKRLKLSFMKLFNK